MTAEDERDRLTGRVTFPIDVHPRLVLRSETQLRAPTDERLVDGVTITGQRDRGGLRQRLELALGNRAHQGLQFCLFGRELEIHQIRSVVALRGRGS